MIVTKPCSELINKNTPNQTYEFFFRPLDIPEILQEVRIAQYTAPLRALVNHCTSNTEHTPLADSASHLFPDIPPKDSLETSLSLCIRELILNSFMWGNKSNMSLPIMCTTYEGKSAKAVRISDMGEGFNLKRILEKRDKGEVYWKNGGRGTSILHSVPFPVAYDFPGNSASVFVPLKPNQFRN